MNNIIEHWQILVGMITTFFAYLGGKKIKTIEEKKAGSDALTLMQLAYNNFVKDVDSRYDDMRLEMNSLKDEVIQLRKENTDLRRELREWETKYYKLKKQLDEA